MATEPRTGLTFYPPGAEQPDLLFNAMLYWIAVWAQPVILSVEDDPPVSPDEGDTYLVGTGTGDWDDHDDDLTYWDGAAWLFFSPLPGYVVRNIDTGDMLVYDAGWAVWPGGGGGSETDTIITEASPFTAVPATHAGRSRYIRAGGDVEFDVAEGYSAGEIYKVRATGAIQLVGTGVTLTPPYGGSLDLDADMAVQIVMTSSSAGDVVGQTVPA